MLNAVVFEECLEGHIKPLSNYTETLDEVCILPTDNFNFNASLIEIYI